MSKVTKNLPLAFAIAISVAACAHQKSNVTTKTVAGGDQAPVGVSAHWLKVKGQKTDIMLQITNNTKKDLEIDTADLQCMRGNDTGSVRHDFSSAYKVGVIVLAPEQSRTDLMHCNFGAKGTGNITLKVEQVFESHEEDQDKRKVVAKNLAWELVSNGPAAD